MKNDVHLLNGMHITLFFSHLKEDHGVVSAVIVMNQISASIAIGILVSLTTGVTVVNWLSLDPVGVQVTIPSFVGGRMKHTVFYHTFCGLDYKKFSPVFGG